MHDLRWVREHPADFDRGMTRRGLLPQSKDILQLDRQWREALTREEEAQRQRNITSKQSAASKSRGTLSEQSLLIRQSAEQKAKKEAAAAAAERLRSQIDE